MIRFAATIVIRCWVLWSYATGWPDHTGLTVRCRGCDDPSPHDAHLAPGALTYLGRNR